MEDALRIIITKSPRAALEAVRTMSALRANSPVIAHRYSRCVEMALADPGATFTPEDRATIAAHVDASDTPDGARPHTLRVRMSDAEMAAVQEAAGSAGETVSAWVRRRLFHVSPPCSVDTQGGQGITTARRPSTGGAHDRTQTPTHTLQMGALAWPGALADSRTRAYHGGRGRQAAVDGRGRCRALQRDAAGNPRPDTTREAEPRLRSSHRPRHRLPIRPGALHGLEHAAIAQSFFLTRVKQPAILQSRSQSHTDGPARSHPPDPATGKGASSDDPAL